MRKYSNSITLTKNRRGIYSLDPIIGCKSGMELGNKGWYDDGYAARIAKRYGYDFGENVLRNFDSITHLHKIRNEININGFPFIRMGTMGDPSEDWEHTISICEKIQMGHQLSMFKYPEKEIVIITKHWNILSINQLNRIKKLKICINTSISVLDNVNILNNGIKQYEILKKYCRSILRLVSCDFNIKNSLGFMFHTLQENIIYKYNVLDTVFRVSSKNELVLNGIINIHKTKFLGMPCLISKYNKKTYFGKCDTCIEKCGINI